MDPTPAPEVASIASSSLSAAAEDLARYMAVMMLEEWFATLRGIGEECIQEDELMRLLQNKPVPICYDGFEPSGRMHIAQVGSGPWRLSSCDLSGVIASRALYLRR